MKTVKLSMLALLLSGALTAQAETKQIDFHIKGINDSKGKLYIQLFKGRDDYIQGKPSAATIVKAEQDSATVSFYNIAPGDYALRFFHDQNDNGEMETNLFGMPTEGYGFSNDAKPNFGPVSYEDIAFSVAESQTLVSNTTTVIY